MSRREPSRTIVLERSGSSSLLWFLVGGALGAGLALLFAPDSGDRTRRAVGRRLNKLRDAAGVALEDLREAWLPGEGEPDTPGDADELEEEEEEAALEATPSLDGDQSDEEAAEPERRSPLSARRELEQRLAEARARRRRVLADEDEEPVA